MQSTQITVLKISTITEIIGKYLHQQQPNKVTLSYQNTVPLILSYLQSEKQVFLPVNLYGK